MNSISLKISPYLIIKELAYGGSSNMNEEGIPCFGATDVEETLSKLDTVGPRGKEHGLR